MPYSTAWRQNHVHPELATFGITVHPSTLPIAATACVMLDVSYAKNQIGVSSRKSFKLKFSALQNIPSISTQTEVHWHYKKFIRM